MAGNQPLNSRLEPLRSAAGEAVLPPAGEPIFTPLAVTVETDTNAGSKPVNAEAPAAQNDELDNAPTNIPDATPDDTDDADAADGDWREDILGRFRAWLYEFTGNDRVTECDFDDEPNDDYNEAAPDLHTLLGEIIALKQETRLQARAAQQAGQTIAELAEALRAELRGQTRALSAAAGDLKAQLPAARREGQMAAILELLNIRGALDQAVQVLDGLRIPDRPWLRAARAALTEAARSQRLCLDKADDALRRLNIRPAAETGQRFNPLYMRAVIAGVGSGAASGTVTRVLRQGYLKGDDILQTAEVEVEKQP